MYGIFRLNIKILNMKNKSEFELQALNTIGYLEANDKVSFMTGVSVALHISNEYYQNEINNLKKQIEGLKYIYDSAINDLKTLSSIINRYSDID